MTTRMYYKGDDLMVELGIGEGSTFTGDTVFYGTLQQLKKRLSEV